MSVTRTAKGAYQTSPQGRCPDGWAAWDKHGSTWPVTATEADRINHARQGDDVEGDNT